MAIRSLTSRLRKLERASKLGSLDDLLRSMLDYQLGAIGAALEAVISIEDEEEPDRVAVEIIAEQHGMSHTKVHNAWLGMRDRVDDPKWDQYPNYGGRGIRVCDEWQGEKGFDAFYAHIGDPPTSNHSLDRIDVNRHYEPGNNGWATPKEQMNNKRDNRIIEAFGRSLPLTQWAEERLINAHTIAMRLKLGWLIERALILPAKVWSYELRKFIRPSPPAA